MSHFGPTLESIHNPRVKYARSLHVRKNRYRERAFLVEGTRLFFDAIESGAVPLRVFVNQSVAGSLAVDELESLAEQGVPVHPASERVIEAISDTQTPQGLIAVFEIPDNPIQFGDDPPLIVVADGVKDPGNLGTLMRSALGAGAHAFFVSPQTTDPYSPKVVRAGMGVHFRLPTAAMDWSNPPQVISDCAQRFAAEAGAENTYDRVDWTQPTTLVIGSEAMGISKSAGCYVSERVSIPLKGHLESLNAAMAGAVILFEAARQRRTQ